MGIPYAVVVLIILVMSSRSGHASALSAVRTCEVEQFAVASLLLLMSPTVGVIRSEEADLVLLCHSYSGPRITFPTSQFRPVILAHGTTKVGDPMNPSAVSSVTNCPISPVPADLAQPGDWGPFFTLLPEFLMSGAVQRSVQHCGDYG